MQYYILVGFIRLGLQAVLLDFTPFDMLQYLLSTSPPTLPSVQSVSFSHCHSCHL